ncbi:MAG: aminomethyl-transferring glycine dehydrogenase subunit GcvPB [Hydrogenobacter thermophilus]|uniref:aminomethyl-transferring glycine dehydrogenase subunit GcvPB n=1 Tax=Hydrogenobacter thermophilus TaxID=940 RepID=UPI001C7807A2|nr:aminomethyl-transferring glycine dehydrogenase subunit GcvPB [Hydrogenobacter thermophilus]QWK20054.1 MAG: aminomethyl-transferring glycine dehydrogenase subunit GcvPB [Hydrogenobacter thermophilus]
MKLIFELSKRGRKGFSLPSLDVPEVSLEEYLGEHFRKELDFPEVSELDAIRHYTNLSKLNYSVDTNFYPLGSCSMKYNPRIAEEISRWEEFTDMHPMTPEDYAQGSLEVIYRLKELLKELGGFSEVSLEPAAGAQGELLGLLLIRAYHMDMGKEYKRKILIPDSAHGTNPASAAVCGFEVITVKSDANGELDWRDFSDKLKDDVAGLMITNPNTLGIFERRIKDMAQALHEKDALLYMDGANFNALVGIAKPGLWGVDIMHFNLHKTFGTPHGGGGPGGGAVGVSEKLVPYLPVPQVEFDGEKYFLSWDRPKSVGKMLSFYGHFSVMLKALAYILSYGNEISRVAKYAVLNARYLRHLLKGCLLDPYEHVPCMHEFVLSALNLVQYDIKAIDIAKALLDRGFYAPTVYFPLIVKEALMIEPTETESVDTLRAFAKSLTEIIEEAKRDPQKVKASPEKMPVRRIKEVEANRKPVLRYAFKSS